MNRNGSSVDFPFILSYEKDIKTRRPELPHQLSRNYSMRNMSLNSYTNETMDPFRLDYDKENTIGYHNKYLDYIKPIDRSQIFKDIEKTRQKINLIDILKNNRKLSQDPNILKKIISNDEINMLNQKSNNSRIKSRNNNQARIVIDKEKADHLYHEYNPIKFSPILLSNLNLPKTSRNTSNIQLYYSTPKYPSSYLFNNNDYSIKEAQSIDCSKFLKYKLKGKQMYNIINEQTKEIKEGEIAFPKWSSFYENYLQMKDDGFPKKGGEFSEFLKMHPDLSIQRQRKIDMIKENRLNKVENKIVIPYSREQSAKNRVKYKDLLKKYWNCRKNKRCDNFEHDAIIHNPLHLSKSEKIIKSKEAREIIESRNLVKLREVYRKKII